LAKGFESFMAGEQGQRLFLKYGLLPVRKPGRKIQIRYQ
jgi:phosphate transport system substrate-binding protein